MTGADFAAWVAAMKATRKWTKTRCAKELGCGINQIAVWSAQGAPTYIGLACAALDPRPVAPWSEPKAPDIRPRERAARQPRRGR